jgi:hypothetical protein
MMDCLLVATHIGETAARRLVQVTYGIFTTKFEGQNGLLSQINVKTGMSIMWTTFLICLHNIAGPSSSCLGH